MKRFVLASAVWLALVIMLWASDSRPAVAVLGGVVAVLAVGVYTAIDLARAVAPPWQPQADVPVVRSGSDPRVDDLRRDLDAAAWTESTAVHDSIVELVDHRLRDVHGVDRSEDPAAADDLLSPALRQFVAGPHRTDTSVRRLTIVLDDLEELGAT